MRRVVSPRLLSKNSSISAARLLVIGLTGVALAGCASKGAPNYAGAATYDAGAPRSVTERQWKVEIEDDGKPAQAPPARRMRPEEDDPSQPWSPNYGRKNPQPIAPQPGPSQVRPWPKPVEAAHRSSMNERDADAIIAAAVNAHEMRKP